MNDYYTDYKSYSNIAIVNALNRIYILDKWTKNLFWKNIMILYKVMF